LRIRYCLLFSIALSLPILGYAQRPINQHPVYAPEEEEKGEWVEESVASPAYPQDSDLIPLAMTPSSNEFFVDRKSIVLGADKVLRYTMLIRSSAGAVNVTHEGIRCETREKKLYYLGRKDGTWGTARAAKWSTITGSGAVTYQKILMNDFFCPKEVSVKSAAEAISALRAGIHPQVRTRSGR
jgi:CNP1-like family